MRVLEVTHYMPPHQGGIERIAAALADGLRARGHQVHWIASATPERPSTSAELTRVGAWNVLEERIGVPYPLWSPRGLRLLRERVAWADVVHVHDCLYMGSVAAAMACRRSGTPLLVTQHVGYVPFGRGLDLLEGLAYRLIGLPTLRAASAVVAYSGHVVDHFTALGLGRPFQLIPNAVHTGRFAPAGSEARASARARFGLRAVGPVVLFVGRLVPKKRPGLVAEVQRRLAPAGVTLLVVGDGPLAAELDGVPGAVRVAGLDPEAMPAAYAAADVFLLPSCGEGLPVSVQEALLCGLPVVVSDDPSYTANLGAAPGVAMVAGGAGELAQACRRWLEAPPDSAALAGWARQRWDPGAFISSYEALLEGLDRGARGRRSPRSPAERRPETGAP